MRGHQGLIFVLLFSTICYAETTTVTIPQVKLDEINTELEKWNKKIGDNPNDAEAYRQRGLVYERKHDNNQAISDYNKGIEVNQNLALLFWNRGLLFYKNGSYDQAIADFSKYLQSKPNSPLTLLFRGEAYYKHGNFDAAVSDFKSYIITEGQWGKWDPHLAYINLAFTYLMMKDYDKAQEFANKASDDPYASHDPLMVLGSYDDLIKELKQVSDVGK